MFALLSFVITKRQSDPYVSGSITALDDGRYILHVTIHPAQQAMRFVALSVRGAKIGKPEFDYDPCLDTIKYHPSQNLSSGRLGLDISLPPAKVSLKPVERSFLIESRKSQSSWDIALHTRFMFLPVKYKITARIINDRA
ncbi:hypothetical protein D7I39_11020 [Allopusillimonas ginsengisoli]|nr:hypothetical protein D7I39_11020 [Allopusillimonas ginsengisoli]